MQDSYLVSHKNAVKSRTGIHFRIFWKTCLSRPADSLRCLPVTAVRPVLYLDLQSNYTKFLHFVPFCFFRWRTAVSCFSSIDRFQLVCFARVATCNVINLKQPLNGKQNVWKYQNGEEKSDLDGREKDV